MTLINKEQKVKKLTVITATLELGYLVGQIQVPSMNFLGHINI